MADEQNIITVDWEPTIELVITRADGSIEHIESISCAKILTVIEKHLEQQRG